MAKRRLLTPSDVSSILTRGTIVQTMKQLKSPLQVMPLPSSAGDKSSLMQNIMLDKLRRNEAVIFLNLEMSPKKVEDMIARTFGSKSRKS